MNVRLFQFQAREIITIWTKRKRSRPLNYIHRLPRVSMGLTDRRKTAQKLVDSRTNWKILTLEILVKQRAEICHCL